MTAPTPTSPQPPGDVRRLGPLAGFTVGVTADRRRAELVTMLRRRGAEVVEAPALQITPLHDDRQLEAATRAVLTNPPDIAVATTGVGFRGWLEAAEGWGLGERLRALLARATILTRGPKATGAVRAAGLRDAWSPSSESVAELLDHLLAQDLSAQSVVLQEHGTPLPEVAAALRRAGASVIAVPVYRWAPPPDPRPLARLVRAACAGQVDAVTFTSAPAVDNLFAAAARAGREDDLAAALRGEVLAACVGPVCAAPLQRRGIPTVRPDRGRLGALVRTIETELPARQARTLTAAGHRLVLRGRVVLVDDRPVQLPPVPAAVLRALMNQPDRVFSRAELLRLAAPAAASGPAGEHAVEMTVTRLRRALGPAAPAVQTVVKRGYRLTTAT